MKGTMLYGPRDTEYVGTGGAQAPYLRVRLANGTLLATPVLPPNEIVPRLLAASDVQGTGWFAADAGAVTRSLDLWVLPRGTLVSRREY